MKILITSFLAGVLLFTGCSSKEDNVLPEELKSIRVGTSSFYGDNVFYSQPEWIEGYTKEGFLTSVGVASYSLKKEEQTDVIVYNYAIKDALDKLKFKFSNLLEKENISKNSKLELVNLYTGIIQTSAAPKYKWIDRNYDFYVLVEMNKKMLELKMERLLLKYNVSKDILSEI